MTAPTHALVVVEDERALAQAVAERVIGGARDAIAARGTFDVALAGGSTPKAAYALLASPALRSAVPWARVRFFFGDERCVPPDDPQSNFKMADDALFRRLGVAHAAVHRMRGEAEPAAAAAEYAEVLRRELRLEARLPRFDLVLLGMGPDGHTASLFPGSDPFADDAALVRAPFVEKFGTHRITLTPSVLGNAREVVIAAAGDAKAAALAAVLDGPADPAAYPVQSIVARGGSLTWLVDEAAAAGVRREAPGL